VVSTTAASSARQAELVAQFHQSVKALFRFGFDVRGKTDNLNDATVLFERQQLLVIHIAADVRKRSHTGVRRDDRRLRKSNGFEVGAFRGMREINHHAQAIHFRDHLAAQGRQAIVVGVALGLSGIGIGKLAVAVVRQ